MYIKNNSLIRTVNFKNHFQYTQDYKADWYNNTAKIILNKIYEKLANSTTNHIMHTTMKMIEMPHKTCKYNSKNLYRWLKDGSKIRDSKRGSSLSRRNKSNQQAEYPAMKEKLLL